MGRLARLADLINAGLTSLLQELGFIEPVAPKPSPQPTIANGALQLDDGSWLRGADIELFEKCSKPQAVFKPNRIRINGVEILTADEPFAISPISKRHAASIRVTMYINTLTIHGEQPDDATL